jgi:serpin B
MPRAFSRAAQFPRLVSGEATQLGFVQHAVKVEVDEKGTRAAAVTVVGVRAVSLPMGYLFDKPFVFVIRERLSGTVLFVGVVRNPLGS